MTLACILTEGEPEKTELVRIKVSGRVNLTTGTPMLTGRFIPLLLLL